LPFFISGQTLEGAHAEAFKWSPKYWKLCFQAHDQVMLWETLNS